MRDLAPGVEAEPHEMLPGPLAFLQAHKLHQSTYLHPVPITEVPTKNCSGVPDKDRTVITLYTYARTGSETSL